MKLRKLAFLTLFAGMIPFLVISCGKNNNQPKCLAVGSARSVMITENQEAPGSYIVTVNGSNPSTVLLTQEPKRNSKVIETDAFMGNWDTNYKEGAPNVTFTSVNPNRTTTNVLVLTEASYDAKTQTMTFKAEKLEKEDDSVQTGTFTNVTITYDSEVGVMNLKQVADVNK